MLLDALSAYEKTAQLLKEDSYSIGASQCDVVVPMLCGGIGLTFVDSKFDVQVLCSSELARKKAARFSPSSWL